MPKTKVIHDHDERFEYVFAAAKWGGQTFIDDVSGICYLVCVQQKQRKKE